MVDKKKCDQCGKGKYAWDGCSRVECAQRRHVTAQPYGGLIPDSTIEHLRHGFAKAPTNKE